MTDSVSLIERGQNENRIYSSLLVEPKNLGIFNSELPIRIIRELSQEPGCAMDLARKLKQHEQKIYYHLRKLEAVGLIRPIKTEKRYGMIAKIYKASFPVIATKLYEDGQALMEGIVPKDPDMMKFLHPFVENGKLNATIIIGDPNEHGRFDRRSKGSAHITDFAIFLGSFIKEHNFPYYKLDTEVEEKDLKNNLILLGSIRTNVIMDRIKENLPLRFNEEGQFYVVSKNTGKSYKDSRIGFIMKTKNPFNSRKWILAMGGLRTRGTRASLVALTKNVKNVYATNEKETLRIVKGLDRSGNGIVDYAEVIE